MNTLKTTTSGRIDKILATELNVSRNQVEKLVKDGLVSVNGKSISKTSFKVAEDDEITYAFKEAETFVFWGFLHGMALVIHRFWKSMGW